MYDSLLLSTGGGIVSQSQKSPQTKDPVVVIGCGGVGIAAANVLKRKVYKQLQPDNPGDPIPEYNHIRFLAVDCDEGWISGTELNNDAEFCNLKDTKLKEKLTNRVHMENMLKNPKYDWISLGQKGRPNIQVPDNLNGAGGIRQIGRYLAIGNSHKLRSAIFNTITNAVSGRESDKLVVHILAGISGGMGSGSFIDVCYIVQHILAERGFTGASVFGYFFLPDVIVNKAEIAGDPTKVDSNNVNGYAALKELDYLMQLKENNDWFKQGYDGFNIETQNAPVDMCYLISAIDANGNQRPDGFKYCINVTADYIMSYLSDIQMPDENTRQEMTPAGVLSNVGQNMNYLPKTTGAYHRYHILGAASAELPMTQIATYLATGLYAKMSPLLLHEPVDADVDVLVKDLNYTVAGLKKMVLKGARLGVPVPEPEMDTVKGITGAGNHAASIREPLFKWLAAQEGILQRNLNILSEEKEFTRSDGAEALGSILFNKLYDYAVDPEYGPVFAAMLLNRNGKTLLHHLQSLHGELQKLIQTAITKEDSQSEQTELAKQAFCASKNKFFNKKIEARAYENYRRAMGTLFQRRLDISTYKTIDRLVLMLMNQVQDISILYLDKLKEALNELKTTFAANATFFEGGYADGETAEDGYTLRIIQFKDMKRSLDNVLNQVDVKYAASSFAAHMLANADSWKSGEERQIHAVINSFVVKFFHAQLNCTMTDYLQFKYPGLSSAQLQKQLQKDLMVPLYRASTPCFWATAEVTNASTHNTTFLTVPATAREVVGAAEEYAKGVEYPSIRACEIGDRIFMVNMKSGLPLYAYHGLGNTCKTYNKYKGNAGLHLYERGAGETVNWKKKLQSPVPFSFDQNEYENPAVLRQELDQAFERNILMFDEYNVQNVQCILKISPLWEDEAFMSLLEKCLADDQARKKFFPNAGVSAEAQQVLDILQRAYDSYAAREFEDDLECYNVLCDARGGGNPKLVAEDNLIHAFRLYEIMQKELKLYDNLSQAIANLKDTMEQSAGEADVLELFANAMVTGLLVQGIGKITYRYVNKYREYELILAKQGMKFQKFIMYQAYLSFTELDEAILNDINEQAQEKLENLQEGDEMIARKILMKHDVKMLEDLYKETATLAQGAEIEAFYDVFLSKLTDFVKQFDI